MNFSGELNVQFYLSSDFYIPQYTIDKFNHMTSFMMESGIFRFVEHFYEFLKRLWSSIEINGYGELFDYQPISMTEFYNPLMFYVYYTAIAFFILISEIIWFRIQHRCRSFYDRFKQMIIQKVRRINFK